MPSMREAAGLSFKSALFHTWLRDTRSGSLTNARGHLFRFSQELAGRGLGGDAAFYKAQVEAHTSVPVGPGAVGSFRRPTRPSISYLLMCRS